MVTKKEGKKYMHLSVFIYILLTIIFNVKVLMIIIHYKLLQCLVAVRHRYFRKGFDPESEVLKEYENQVLGVKGKVYEKKPAKVELKPGKNYHWCSCGYSHSQVCKLAALVTRSILRFH